MPAIWGLIFKWGIKAVPYLGMAALAFFIVGYIENKGKLEEIISQKNNEIVTLNDTIRINREVQLKQRLALEEDAKQALADAREMEMLRREGRALEQFLASRPNAAVACFDRLDTDELRKLWGAKPTSQPTTGGP